MSEERMNRNKQCIFPTLKGNYHGILFKKLFVAHWHIDRQVRLAWDLQPPDEKRRQLYL